MEQTSKESPPAGPAPSAPPAGEPAQATTSPAPPGSPRPPLEVRAGGRIRLGPRKGTVLDIRMGSGKYFFDMKILFDGEEKPVWHGYSGLQTLRETGELEILEPGKKRCLLARLFGK